MSPRPPRTVRDRQPRPRWRQVVRRHLRSAPGRGLTGILAVLVVVTAATGAAGGFEEAEVRQLPQVTVAEGVDLGRFQVTVLDAVVTDQVEIAALESAEGASAWLLVRATVEVTGDETVRYPPDPFLLPEGLVLDEPSSRAVLVRDGARLNQLHPGMPEEVAYLWPVAGASDVPSELALELVGYAKSRSVLYAEDVWGSRGPVARMTVPVDGDVPLTLVEEPW